MDSPVYCKQCWTGEVLLKGMNGMFPSATREQLSVWVPTVDRTFRISLLSFTPQLLSPARTLDDEVSVTPASVSPTAHLEYLPCEGSESVSPNVRSHPRLYVRAEGHTGQQESFL